MHSGRRLLLAAAVLLGSGLVALAETPEDVRYWYEDYLRAIELADDERPKEAMELLATVIRRQPDPQHLVRVPGNQYVGYFPYLERAHIERQLGDYAASRRSLERSETYGEVLKDEVARARLLRLRAALPAGRGDEQRETPPGPPNVAG